MAGPESEQLRVGRISEVRVSGSEMCAILSHRRNIIGVAVAHEDERVAGATSKERTLGRGCQLIESIDAAFDRGDIDRVEWHRRIGAIIGQAYLAAADPRGQSGSSGRTGSRHAASSSPRLFAMERSSMSAAPTAT